MNIRGYCGIINKKVLPVSLATILMFNITTEVVAQTVSLEELKKEHKARVEAILEDAWREQEHALQDTIPPYDRSKTFGTREFFNKHGDIFYESSLKNPIVRRAEEISYIIWARNVTTPPSVSSKWMSSTMANKYRDVKKPGVSNSYETAGVPFLAANAVPDPLSREEFISQYSADLNKQYQKSMADISAQQRTEAARLKTMQEGYLAMQQYNADAVNDWAAGNLKDLDAWAQQSQQKINAAFAKDKAFAPKRYAAYKQDYEKAKEDKDEQQFSTLVKLGNELISLYFKDKEKIKPYVFAITPMLLVVRNKGRKVYSDKMEEFLLNLYKQELSKNSKACMQYGSCENQYNAMVGISILGKSTEDGKVVYDFILNTQRTGVAAKVFLIGAGALLTLKQYDFIEYLLSAATEGESDKSMLDLMSFTAPVEKIGNTNGKYLGAKSTANQYAVPQGYTKNAWADLAMMLANEGSPSALRLLRNFGVQRCVVQKNQGKNKSPYSIDCAGLMPFLYGAILSGKSGVDEYVVSYKVAGTEEFTADGRVRTINDFEATASQKRANSLVANFNDYAKEQGLTKDALMASYIMNLGFGDIDTATESNIDQTLYEAFRNQFTDKDIGYYCVIEYHGNTSRITEKEKRAARLQTFKDLAMLADLALAIYCIWDAGIMVVGGSAKAARGTWTGIKILNGMRIARFGTEVERLAYLRGNIGMYKALKQPGRMAKFAVKFKNSMEPVVIGQRALYTSAPLPSSALISTKGTSTFATALKNTAFSASEGSFVMNTAKAYNESFGQPNRVLDLQKTKQILKETERMTYYKTKSKILRNYKFRKNFDAAFEHQLAKYKDNPLGTKYIKPITEPSKKPWSGLFDDDIDFARNWLTQQKQNPAFKFNTSSPFTTWGINNFSYISNRAAGENEAVKTYELFLDKGSLKAEGLPIEVTIPEKLPSINKEDLTRLLLQKEGDDYWLKFVVGENKLVDPNIFKIGIADNSMPAIIKAARDTKDPLFLKLSIGKNAQPSFFQRIGGKDNLWGGRGTVFFKENGILKPSNIVLQTNTKYDGIKAILGDDGVITLLSNDLKIAKEPFSFSLPKNQITNFVNLTPNLEAGETLQLSLLGGREKINALFYANAISLSAASTGLVGHLNSNFRKDDGSGITDSQVFKISVILPYAFSAFSPAIYPFVKRFGAINVLTTSMATSFVAVTFPMFFGYHGFGGIEPANPNNPPIWPLFVSASLIGFSAALTRSSFNPLMQSVGGGANLLKSMAFKNLSSFAMVLPPVIVLGASSGIRYVGQESGWWNFPSIKYAKDSKGNLKLNSEQKPIQVPNTDFSLSYPFLAVLVGGCFLTLKAAGLSSSIGAVEGYKFSGGVKGIGANTWFGKTLPTVSSAVNAVYMPSAGLFKEGINSSKYLFKKEVFPVIVGSTLALGAEASFFNSYGSSAGNSYVAANFNKVTSVLGSGLGAAAVSVPFFALKNKTGFLKFFNAANSPTKSSLAFGGAAAIGGAGGYMLYRSVPELLFGETSKIDSENPLVPFIYTTTAAIAPFIVRYKSKALLELFGGEKNPAAYNRLLVSSLIVSGAGAYVMATQNDPLQFYVGLGLVGIGFASTTNTFLKVAGFNIERTYGARSLESSLLKTNTDVVYPGVHVGMALIPEVYGRTVTANVEKLGLKVDSEKNEAKKKFQKEYLWIPAISLGGASVFALKGVGMLPSVRLPAGSVFGAKMLLGGYNMFAPKHDNMTLDAYTTASYMGVRDPKGYVKYSAPVRDFNVTLPKESLSLKVPKLNGGLGIDKEFKPLNLNIKLLPSPTNINSNINDTFYKYMLDYNERKTSAEPFLQTQFKPLQLKDFGEPQQKGAGK